MKPGFKRKSNISTEDQSEFSRDSKCISKAFCSTLPSHCSTFWRDSFIQKTTSCQQKKTLFYERSVLKEVDQSRQFRNHVFLVPRRGIEPGPPGVSSQLKSTLQVAAIVLILIRSVFQQKFKT